MNATNYPHSLTLLQEKQKAYLLLQRLLLLFSGSLLFYALLNNSAIPFIYLLLVIVAGSGFLFIANFYTPTLLKTYLKEKTAGLLISLSWLFVQPQWMAPLTLGLTLLFAVATSASRVWVGDNILLTTGPFKRTYQWNQLQQVIIKDGLLTLDFKNNRLWQQPIDSTTSTAEKAFNVFCQTQLQQHATHA
jgi:hypothetical protein